MNESLKIELQEAKNSFFKYDSNLAELRRSL